MGNLKTRLFYWFLLPITTVVVISCAPLNVQVGHLDEWSSESSTSTFNTQNTLDIENIFNKTGCHDFRTYVWNYIYKIVSFEGGKPPPFHTTRNNIRSKMSVLTKDLPAKKEDIEKFIELFIRIYASVTEFMDKNESRDAAEILVQFEYGVTDPMHSAFINKLKSTFEELDRVAKKLKVTCEEESIITEYDNYGVEDNSYSYPQTSQWDIPWFNQMRQSVHPLVYGARKVMSTAYQSCSVLDLPLMSNHHKTKGINIISKHPSGNGWRRGVSSLNRLNNSHYYLSQMTVPAYSQCLNVNQYPLIYDFGGKPYTASGSINLFKNSGSGSKFLGVDCSGFVTSAMATAGLRLKSRVPIRPVHVRGINSWMLRTAERNKLSCLKKQDISAHNPLKSGDIIASNSHVVIAEFVSPDPFGLEKIRSESECHSKRININNFRFTIIQSSNHNNGVGINRMNIQEASGNLSSLKRGLQRIASRACYKMYGKNQHLDIKEASVLRHASKESACRDREIYLENQECLKSCSPDSIDSI